MVALGAKIIITSDLTAEQSSKMIIDEVHKRLEARKG